MLVMGDDNVARLYDDIYDIVIHCESEEEQKQAIEHINSVRWIPVDEEMPPWNEEVIITVLDDHGDTPYTYTTAAWWLQDTIWISDNDIVQGEVLAWMSLPKPYKE